MKKSVLLLFSLVLLSNLCFALELDIKNTYYPYETLIASFSGDFISNPLPKDILFYQDYKQVSIISDLTKINNTIYAYALLPGSRGNYTLIINNTIYKENGTIKKENLEKNFTISSSNNTNDSIIQVKPGFITAKGNFYISLENKGLKKNISIKFFDQEKEFSLSQNETRKIFLTSSGIKEERGEIKITSSIISYNIPVKIIHTAVNNVTQDFQFAFKDKEINATLPIDKPKLFTTELFNYAFANMSDIILGVEDAGGYVKVSPQKTNISSGNSIKVNITIESSKLGEYSGKIFARFQNLEANISIFLNFTDNRTSIVTDSSDITADCKDLDICDINEKCSKDEIDGILIKCCPGICEPVESGSTSWIGIIIITAVILIAAGIFLFIKFKKTKNAGDLIKEQGQKYEEIINPDGKAK